MQTAQGNKLQSLRAVHAFLNENAAKLTGVATRALDKSWMTRWRSSRPTRPIRRAARYK